MPDYKDLKSVAFIEQILAYASRLLGIDFKATGKYRFRSYCPFHADTRDSFRVYVNGKDEVRFHCFGACNQEWDIYDLIMIREKCGFREAQRRFADFLGIEDFVPYAGGSDPRPAPTEIPEPDTPVEFTAPAELSPEVSGALDDTVGFYHSLLNQPDHPFDKVRQYLHKRGVSNQMIQDFHIGYAPPFKDEQYLGRALLQRHIARFNKDYISFQAFSRAGLFRLLNEGGFFTKYIDFRKDMWGAFGAYADFFAGRITFPIYDQNSKIHGIVGRRPDNRGSRWVKQQADGTDIQPISWLYGIDKAARYIRHYKTVIIVEGIFDYFAFYNLLQDQGRPIVVSTLGTILNDTTRGILEGLGIENYVVAYDWDDAGQRGITKIAEKTGATVYYLGGMEPGQDPADKLQGALPALNGFSIRRLTASAKKIQERTEKAVKVEFITCGPRNSRSVILEPNSTLKPIPTPGIPPKQFWYSVDEFLPLLSYDNGNKALLEAKIRDIIKMITENGRTEKCDKAFRLPYNFVSDRGFEKLGPALILWLRIVIEQQSRRRFVRETDSTIAAWLNTSRQTVSSYKNILNSRGFLVDRGSHRKPKLSVRFFIPAHTPRPPQ